MILLTQAASRAAGPERTFKSMLLLEQAPPTMTKKNGPHLLGQRVAQVCVISARNETLIKAKPGTSMCNSKRNVTQAGVIPAPF